MGDWGTAISSNDTYADIHGAFFDLYNAGFEIDEISKRLVVDNEEIINDTDDCNNFWFALAKAQWECKRLDEQLFDKVKKIIESETDLEVWRQLDATPKDIKKRKIALNKFLAELQIERPKAKKRKTKIIRQPIFDKGDCLIFKLANGNYGGAVILEALRDAEYGYNLIATTRINQENRPTRTDFERAEVLILNYANWNDDPNIKWYLPLRHKQVAHLMERVGNIEVLIEYDINSSMFGNVGDFDIWIIQVADEQFKLELIKPRPTIILTIKELT